MKNDCARVTISGADDAVDPDALAILSADFPFVEWGILLSPKREGTPRYPTRSWVDRLVARHNCGLAAHLCGQYTRDAEVGKFPWPIWHRGFSRVQINGWEKLTRGIRDAVSDLRLPPIILQVRSEEQLAAICDEKLNTSILYDPSGGTGRRTEAWPAIPSHVLGFGFGYAGGICPENVEEVLAEIGAQRMPYWIDMESGVRRDDQFDLYRVRDVLSKVAALKGVRDG